MSQIRTVIHRFLAQIRAQVCAGTTAAKTLIWYEGRLQCLEPLHKRSAKALRPADLADIQITNARARAIKRLFAWALEMDYVKKDYFRKGGLKVPRCGRRKRVLSRRELGRLLHTCRPNLRRLLFVQYHTLARPGEIRSLTWGQINWRERYVTLSEFKGKERRADRLDERKIVLPKHVMRLLSNMYRKSPDRSSTGHVFYNSRGKTWTKDAHVRAMSLARKRVGLDKGDEKVVCYHLRHTAATNAIQEGEELKHVGDLMGHASTTTTERYVHLDTEDMLLAIDRISARHRSRQRMQATASRER